MANTTSQLPTETPGTVARTMGRYTLAHRKYTTITVGFYIINTALGAIIPLQIGAVIDGVVAGQYTDYPWQPLVLILCAILGQAITLCGAAYTANILGQRVTRDISTDTISHTLSLNARTVEEAGSGDLLTRVTDDLSSASTAVSQDLLEVLYVILYFVVSMVSLAAVSAPVSLIFAPMLIGLAFILRYYLPRLAHRNQRVQETTSELNSVLTENVRGALTIRELGIARARQEVFDTYNTQRYETALEMVNIQRNYYTLDLFNAWLPTILCLVWGIFCVDRGWASWGAVATASIMVFSLRTMTDILSHHVRQLRIMLVNMGRVFGVIKLAQTQSTDRENARVRQNTEYAPRLGEQNNSPLPAIECESVSYGYNREAPVLHNISLSLAPGESLALVGRSGSGKTTLARLIGGSLTAAEGSIRVLGEPVGHGAFPTGARHGRPRLLVCTQEAHIFYGTVADNFTIVVPDATESQIGQALDEVGASWWRTLPQQLHTVISGGEHELTRDEIQQLALARIVLANPHAVILDESTTQLELVDATVSLRALLCNRAVLIISHDARIASLADRAVLLDDGRIVAEGTPEEVFALTE